MLLPIPRRLSSLQIFLALAAGTVATVYVWTPIIRDHNNKSKQQKGQTTDSQPQTVDSQPKK